MLTADAELDVGTGRAAPLDAHAHELADAFLVERLERVRREQLVLEVLAT